MSVGATGKDLGKPMNPAANELRDSTWSRPDITEKENLMSTNYRPLSPIYISDLLDGRMENVRMHEWPGTQLRTKFLCLTDGSSNFLWVYLNEDEYRDLIHPTTPQNGAPQRHSEGDRAGVRRQDYVRGRPTVLGVKNGRRTRTSAGMACDPQGSRAANRPGNCRGSLEWRSRRSIRRLPVPGLARMSGADLLRSFPWKRRVGLV